MDYIYTGAASFLVGGLLVFILLHISQIKKDIAELKTFIHPAKPVVVAATATTAPQNVATPAA